MLSLINKYNHRRFNELEEDVVLIKQIEYDHQNDNGIHQQQNCAICIDRLSVPVITILCGHQFHYQCLTQDQSRVCALCRYEQQPEQSQYCEYYSCSSEANILCLTCGMAFCSQCVQKHIEYQPYHQYGRNIQNSEVIDIQNGLPVQRLLVNQKGGIVDPNSSKKDCIYQDGIAQEYNDIIDQLIESQKEYFRLLDESTSQQSIITIDSNHLQIKQYQQQIDLQQQQLDELGFQHQQVDQHLDQLKSTFKGQLEQLAVLNKLFNQTKNQIQNQINSQSNIDKQNRLQSIRQDNEQLKDQVEELKLNLSLKSRLQKVGGNRLQVNSTIRSKKRR